MYIPGSSGVEVALEIVDRTGRAIYTYPEQHIFQSPRFSPDGTHIALAISDTKGQDVYVVDPARGTASRVTFDGTNGVPVWTPDGTRLAYGSTRAGPVGNVFLTRSDGSGEPERLTSSPQVQAPSSFSSDGRLLAGLEADDVNLTRTHLFVFSMADRQVRPIMARGNTEWVPVFSPDGRWIAYESDESGTPEIYVRPYPGSGGKWRVSTASGSDPRWTRGGREIVYVTPTTASRLMAVDISVDGDEVKPGAPAVLFEAPAALLPNSLSSWYDASADGTRFVFLKPLANMPSHGLTHVTLAVNFFDEVRRATAAKR